jgi:hypothetical protein
VVDAPSFQLMKSVRSFRNTISRHRAHLKCDRVLSLSTAALNSRS